ncbi:hypothetical protein ACFL4R_01780 [Nitrospirota bacterium]
MLEYKSHKSGRMGMLVFEGALDEKCYKNMESILMMAVINEEYILLDLTEVTCVNLDCLKLLCTTHRTASLLNRRLKVLGAKRDVFMSALNDSRYCRHVHCVLKGQGECFWENDNNQQPIDIAHTNTMYSGDEVEWETA